MTGWSLTEAHGRPLDEVVQTLAPEGIRSTTMLRNRSGVDIHIDAAETSIRDYDGTMAGTVFVFRDITARQRLERELQAAPTTHAMSALAGGIAHEFDHILGSIMSFAELTQYDVPQGSVSWQNLDYILASSRRAKELVQQTLAFRREGETELARAHLPTVIEEILEFLRSSLPVNIRVSTSVDAEVGSVSMGATQVYQMMLRVCWNAEYAMRNTGGTLEFRVASEVVETPISTAYGGLAVGGELAVGTYARVQVCDTGEGIPADALPRVFEPVLTTEAGDRGAGMGLALVHSLVTQQGGQVAVESAMGRGTTVTIYLPTFSTEPLASPVALQGVPRILCLDEEPSLIMLKQMLTCLGYEPVVSKSSHEAFERFQATPYGFDLVIANQAMPERTGRAFIAACRELRPLLPAILCTESRDAMASAQALASHLDAVLLKPIDKQALSEAVQRLLATLPRGDSSSLV